MMGRLCCISKISNMRLELNFENWLIVLSKIIACNGPATMV